jgi:hypothetical protein
MARWKKELKRINQQCIEKARMAEKEGLDTIAETFYRKSKKIQEIYDNISLIKYSGNKTYRKSNLY